MSRWVDLASSLDALDRAVGLTLLSTDGEVLGLVGGDWIPPVSTDPKAHIEFLTKAYGRIVDTVDGAKNLDDEAKRRTAVAAKRALDQANDLAKDVAAGVVDVVAPGWGTAAERDKQLASMAAMKQKAGDAVETVIDLVPWYLVTIAGVAVAWWVVVGVGAYLYFEKKKSGAVTA